MQSAVLAMIFSLTVRPSVTRWYHAKTTPAKITRSSLQDRPMNDDSGFLTVYFAAKFQGEHGERGHRMREG